jgi:site-specific DNA-methyltransferase (adenine-specific)
MMPVYRRESLSPAEYYEIELETNIRRLGLTWRENIKAVCHIHKTRSQEAIKNREEWTQDMTGELLGGYSKSYVSNCLVLEPIIKEEAFKDCESITDAMRVYYRRLEDQGVAEQARRTGLVQVAAPSAPGPAGEEIVGDLLVVDDNTEHVVDLSGSLFKGDSIRSILPNWPPECVDHIFADPPYAVDMDNLDQTRTSLIDTLRVDAEHQVEENFMLLRDMMPQCYRVLRDSGFFVFWCDQMNWNFLYDHATFAGFGVQRWPIVWCKSQAKNQMAHVNLTKATEIAMVCRKGKAQLPNPVALNWHIAANDETKVSNPFAKPFEIWKFIYEAFSVPGQTVLDPFAGEGSSTVAGLHLNRRALAIEKNETHFNYLVEQVKDHWKSIYNNVKFV